MIKWSYKSLQHVTDAAAAVGLTDLQIDIFNNYLFCFVYRSRLYIINWLFILFYWSLDFIIQLFMWKWKWKIFVYLIFTGIFLLNDIWILKYFYLVIFCSLWFSVIIYRHWWMSIIIRALEKRKWISGLIIF